MSDESTVTKFESKAGACRLIVETMSEGLGARLAYDVTVAASEVSISASIDQAAPERSSAQLSVATTSFDAYKLHKHRNRAPAELSASDAKQIGGKVRDHLNKAFGSKIEVDIGEGKAVRDGVYRLVARVGSAKVDVEVEAKFTDGGVKLAGTGKASLKALGLPKVKAPLGVLVVSDEVTLRLEAELALVSG